MRSHINVHNCDKERNYIKNDRKHDQGHTFFLLERINSKALYIVCTFPPLRQDVLPKAEEIMEEMDSSRNLLESNMKTR
jgi:hypothetical protein